MTQDIETKKDFGFLSAIMPFGEVASDALTGSSGVSIPHISIEGNRFWLRQDGTSVETPNQLKLHFVVLALKKPLARAYYEGAYDPENAGAPTCSSYDGVTPDGGENIQSDRCATCPMSKWGSAVSKRTGKQIVACRQHKEAVVKVLGADGLYVLRIPPFSFKNWDAAVKNILDVIRTEGAKKAEGEANVSFAQVVIEASFAERPMGVLQFKVAGYLKGEEAQKVATEYRTNEAGIVDMLWGPDGAARKAQYEGGSKPAARPVAAPPPVVEEPPFAVASETPAEPRTSRRRQQGAPSSMDVGSILAEIGV